MPDGHKRGLSFNDHGFRMMIRKFRESIGVRLAGLVALKLILFIVCLGVSIAGLGKLRAGTAQLAVSAKNAFLFAKIKGYMTENRAQLMLALQHNPASPLARLHDHPVDMHIDQIIRNRDEITRLWKEEYLVQNLQEEERVLAETYAGARKRYVE
ncbi:MAG: hypothetical protein N3A66_12390, partial [Planctomycetota bacterium]|nr:hypothetical protein [Planctomycetota bacterium]